MRVKDRVELLLYDSLGVEISRFISMGSGMPLQTLQNYK